MIAVELRELSHRLGSFRLEIDTLAVEPGGGVAVCGAAGAGKSLLLRLLAGLERPAAGRVRVLGMDPVAEAVALRQRITWMSDSMALFPVTLGRHGLIHARFHPRWDQAWFLALCTRLDLDPQATLGQMTRSEGARARLALALGHHPEVILLDEPLGALDVQARLGMLGLLADLRADGCTLVLAAQHLGDVQRVVDRAVVLSGGARVAEGPTAEVMAGHANVGEVVSEGGP